MKTFKLCYDVLMVQDMEIDYTYKDGYFHTRLTPVISRIRGFEDKLAFLTSFAFAYFMSNNPLTASQLEDWDLLITAFEQSDEYKIIRDVLKTVGLSKGLKILKPYSKKASISALDLMHSYKPLLKSKRNEFGFHIQYSDLFGCSMEDFLIWDDTEVIVEEESKINLNKFHKKHPLTKEESLWD